MTYLAIIFVVLDPKDVYMRLSPAVDSVYYVAQPHCSENIYICIYIIYVLYMYINNILYMHLSVN